MQYSSERAIGSQSQLGASKQADPQISVADRIKDTAKQERDDAISRLSAARKASSTGLRSSQSASSEIDRLRAELSVCHIQARRSDTEQQCLGRR
jgi:hypothetical protein